MRIIKQGKVPADRLFEMECMNCKTEFEIKQSEGRIVPDQRDGDYITHACPTCGHLCNTDLRLAK